MGYIAKRCQKSGLLVKRGINSAKEKRWTITEKCSVFELFSGSTKTLKTKLPEEIKYSKNQKLPIK